MTSLDHNATACRASKHTRVQHLVTADEHSLTDLEALLATLPLCSTGRVFIEVPDDTWCADIAVPPRMTLTWLDRSRRSGAPGTGRSCAPGEALARAVAAWADEMLCGQEGGTRVFLLGGYLGTADIVDHLTGRIGMPADDIRTPERFGLATAR
ncbi:siderophore-interacting protein [Microbacterium sp. zg-Y818]|uniref:siderophore-interacting protein n=1 Tax=unclassified Microbacterium TaxID=2609290 RepID=UPI00214C7DE4|nr:MULTISPECIES: siderophore-interacting protein [unclassified Microbacterium]MCR2801632.1 siderophore-interacting protein [Microbacterium sp. zg.Y818]WIM23096.1 siderophore-interacting protein [Microbacterium sp. zg-Y818]